MCITENEKLKAYAKHHIECSRHADRRILPRNTIAVVAQFIDGIQKVIHLERPEPCVLDLTSVFLWLGRFLGHLLVQKGIDFFLLLHVHCKILARSFNHPIPLAAKIFVPIQYGPVFRWDIVFGNAIRLNFAMVVAQNHQTLPPNSIHLLGLVRRLGILGRLLSIHLLGLVRRLGILNGLLSSSLACRHVGWVVTPARGSTIAFID